MVKILTDRENSIITKKIKGLSLTQNESNILSKTIRPKLIEIRSIDANSLLTKIEYNQKARAIENKIKILIKETIPKVGTIILCGSAIQTNYKEYNDIDVIIATKNMIDKKEKYDLIDKIRKSAKKYGVTLDIQIYAKDSIIKQYSYSPSLIYQLKDSKVIYGKIKLPTKINLSRLDLMMKLDWSDISSVYSEGKEIYQDIRNAMLVLLLMNKKIDNIELKNSLINILGADLVNRLKTNTASKSEKKIAFSYLRLFVNYLEKELKNPKWEKIVIENH